MLISGHMEELLKKEGFPYELPALRMLATGARGSMRDGFVVIGPSYSIQCRQPDVRKRQRNAGNN